MKDMGFLGSQESCDFIFFPTDQEGPMGLSKWEFC